MKPLPRIRLRTIFLLFFCAAVGLATYDDPLRALGPAIAVAMVIGLLQQAREMESWKPIATEATRKLQFARRFGVVWRLAIAALMAGLILGQMFLAKDLFELPERDDLLLIDPLHSLLPFCVLLVLCNSLVRWSLGIDLGRQRWLRPPLLWTLAIVIVLYIVLDGTTTVFLVHRAVQSINDAIPKPLQRPGVYVPASGTGYRALMLCFGAVVCLIAAGVIVARSANADSVAKTWSWTKSLISMVLLGPVLVFCYWYYTDEYYRLSPDIASAGFSLIWIDGLAGGLIATILITAGAYRITSVAEPKATISTNLARDIELHSLHESFPCLLALGVHSFVEMWFLLNGALHFSPLFGSPSLGHYVSMLFYPTTLLSTAGILAALQLCWVRWRNRSRPVSWRMSGLQGTSLISACATLILILVVGIPTLRAFAMLLWLGPYNLLPLFGL